MNPDGQGTLVVDNAAIQAPGTSTAGVAPPMIAFDTGCRATVISYDVPEATSYEGRHVLTLNDYVLDDFVDVVTDAPTPAPVAPQAAAVEGASSLLGALAAPHAIVTSDST